MKNPCPQCRWLQLAVGTAGLLTAVNGLALTTNSWISPTSSPWNVPANWSAAQLPNTSFDYSLITNP
jgi:hypothetical protein